MGRNKLTVAAIAGMAAIVLAGCSSQDELAGKPFGESESLYSAPTNIEEFIEIAQDATLHLFCEVETEELPYSGSGFHIEIGDDRYIITNAHVIKECTGKDSNIFVYDSDGHAHLSELISYRHLSNLRGEWDVAVLTGRDFGRAITLAEEEPKLGHWVMGVGWPAFLGEWYQQVAMGNILGIAPNRIVINSAVIARGMSGGPLLNSKGELIGVHFARSGDVTRRALAQPVANLCQVAFVCTTGGEPTFPLELPEKPIRVYLEKED